MKHRKILAVLLMLGIIIMGAGYAMHKSPTSIPKSVDTEMVFPLEGEQ